ncbi:hypothetical protein E2C01_048532 [Portunus trituberculatus]|uniref:Uncharacterized protein n=1 Tax=Portunus trituberculatus TaxID=210409 RepID=A0A5B7GAG9_PORTR|nr:hypothetical protein [Portunus trituberculatus]
MGKISQLNHCLYPP